MNSMLLSGAWRLYVRSVAFGLGVLFMVGAAGHLIPAVLPWMLWVTPGFSVLVALLVLAPLVAAGGWRFVLWAAGAYAFALLMDVEGMSSKGLFGDFTFGATLGWKWRGVPLVIGINWMMVLNGAVCLAGRVVSRGARAWRRLAVALLAGLIAAVFDLLMEPVAMRLDYWHWAGGLVPLQNYLLIFVFATLLASFHPRQAMEACDLGTTGRLAGLYVGMQMAFFLVLRTGWRLLG